MDRPSISNHMNNGQELNTAMNMAEEGKWDRVTGFLDDGSCGLEYSELYDQLHEAANYINELAEEAELPGRVYHLASQQRVKCWWWKCEKPASEVAKEFNESGDVELMESHGGWSDREDAKFCLR